MGYIAWGAGAAASPDRLLGPGGKAILPAGYEGYSGGSWSELSGASPVIAGYMTLLFRMYGLYCVLFGFMVAHIRRAQRFRPLFQAEQHAPRHEEPRTLNHIRVPGSGIRGGESCSPGELADCFP